MKQIINILKIYIIALCLCIVPASAGNESGSISIIDDEVVNYVTGETTPVYTVNLSKIFFDNADYNHLDSFHVHPTGASFGLPYESSYFNIIDGGSGSGYIWYDSNASAIYYSFSSNSLIDDSTIDINIWDSDFVNNVTWTGNRRTALNGSGPLNATYPVCIAAVGIAFPNCMGALGGYHSVTTSTRQTDYYNITYLDSGLFTVSVNKGNYLNSKYLITGYDLLSVYSAESSYNKIDINDAIFQYDDGLSLVAQLQSGAFAVAYINSTMSDQAETIYGTGDIQFNKSNYLIGEYANISVNITDYDTELYQYSYSLYNQKNEMVETFNLPASYDGNETYTLSTVLNAGGTWRLRLSACSMGSCLIPYIMDIDFAYLPVDLSVETSTGSGIVDYQGRFLYSDTETIYNNTDIYTKYDLRFVINNTNYNKYKDHLNYYIIHKDPNLIPVSTRQINIVCSHDVENDNIWDWLFEGNHWGCQGDKLVGEPYSSSRAFYVDHPTQNWTNGTYKAYLIEDLSGQSYNLDIINWSVLNTSGQYGGNYDQIGNGGTGGVNPGELPDGDNNDIISSIIDFMALPIFWGLVFIIIGIYYLKNSPQLILPILFILINIEAVVGLLDPYATYIVVITWLVIAMNFIFIQRKTTG